VQRTVGTEGDTEPMDSDWEAIDDKIMQQVYSDDWEDTLPLPFIAAVSTFGAALTGVILQCAPACSLAQGDS
jgi:hypothetical protein